MMHTHYVIMDGRFHTAMTSRALCEQFVAAMTVGWDREKNRAKLGTTELHYDPARFEIRAFEGGVVIRRNGALCGHEATEQLAQERIEAFIAKHAVDRKMHRVFHNARRAPESTEDAVRRITSAWYAIEPLS